MQKKKLFGVPLAMWGIVCLLIAGVWLVVWPSDRAGAATGMRFVVLRWFHALVWLLLALSAWSAAANRPAISGTARTGALIGYVVFMITLLAS